MEPYLCRKGLVQQVWGAQSLNIPNNDWLFPTPGRLPQSPWNILPKSVFVGLRTWAMPDSVPAMSYMAEALNPTVRV